jgi:hypothetical protein
MVLEYHLSGIARARAVRASKGVDMNSARTVIILLVLMTLVVGVYMATAKKPSAAVGAAQLVQLSR